jgi:UPF0716 protein FxsA
MALAVIIAVILFPILELLLMIKIGTTFGLLPLLGLLVGMAIAGGLLLRRQGLATARRAMEQLARNEAPVQSMIDGIGLSLAGFFLLLPGMISDVVGLLLLIPVIRRWFVTRLLGFAPVSFRRGVSRAGPQTDPNMGPNSGPGPAHPGGRVADDGRTAPQGKPGVSPSGESIVIDGEFQRLEERTIRPGRDKPGASESDPGKPQGEDGSPWRR